MNTQQAKFILQGYRPNGADAGDATFCEALAQARTDTELAEWWEKSRAFDRVMGQKLEAVQPPAGLREAILAGGRVTAPTVRADRKSWGRAPWLALAACLALVAALTVTLRPKAGLANGSLSEFVLADAGSLHGHGDYGDLAASLQTTLSQPTTVLRRLQSVDYEALRATGCRTVQFQGRDVLEVCFQRNGVWFHCYIARRADFPTLAAALAPTVTEQKRAGVALWADAAHLYVIVSKSGRAALETIL